MNQVISVRRFQAADAPAAVAKATRAFWERNGFIYVDMIDPLPG
jgi:hypothetical protein